MSRRLVLLGCLLAGKAYACDPKACAPWDKSPNSSSVQHAQGKNDPFDKSLNWVRHEGARSLVNGEGRYVIVESMMWSAMDENGFEVFRHDHPEAGWAFGRPLATMLVPGNVVSAAGYLDEDGMKLGDYQFILRAKGLPSAGMAQRCQQVRGKGQWCSLAISSNGRRQLLYSMPVVTPGVDWSGSEATYVLLAYAGDINRDGLFDFIFRTGWIGGAYCGAEELYLSKRVGRQIKWVLEAGSTFCD